jgi:hypothetical protein
MCAIVEVWSSAFGNNVSGLGVVTTVGPVVGRARRRVSRALSCAARSALPSATAAIATVVDDLVLGDPLDHDEEAARPEPELARVLEADPAAALRLELLVDDLDHHARQLARGQVASAVRTRLALALRIWRRGLRRPP